MTRIKGIVLCLTAFTWMGFMPVWAQTVRILPLGNSITFDYNQADQTNPRPDGQRKSYRFRLYELLNAAGYVFDYTGSENSGNDYFQNTEMDDNGGFPGITDAEMNYLLNTGYNLRKGVQESPGPYLNSHPADIVLLHIGTNDLDESPDDVEDILNTIRSYDSDVIILVARIINRGIPSPLTTLFNDNVEDMVAARNDDRIISVDIENGAGIYYEYEMDDEIHPNPAAYNKMAAKWFEAIDNLNTAPVIAAVPQQSTAEGTAFANLSLDPFVTDDQDPDNLITWTFRQQTGSHLSVTIDANRFLHAAPTNNDWNGSETIRLIAEDSGNGAFKKKDSVEVIFRVLAANDPPVITSSPLNITDEDALYSYTITASDVDAGDMLTYSAPQKPAWLSFNPATRVLSGTPANDNVGANSITLRVSDAVTSVDQPFILNVTNVNDPPVITSQPILTVRANESFFYEITASDVDNGDELTFTAESKPSWLSFSGGTLSGMLAGTPLQANMGDHPIVLRVSDGDEGVLQGFTLTVSAPSGTPDLDNSIIQNVYPNPARDKMYIQLIHRENTWVEILDMTGRLQKAVEAKDTELLEINIADLAPGTYVYKVFQRNITSLGKMIKY
jgi:lysophospholipase L1-like esterase